MTKYYWVPGTAHPVWIIHEVERYGTVAVNAEADTDMGMLYGTEFTEEFPDAYEITRAQYTEWAAAPPSRRRRPRGWRD